MQVADGFFNSCGSPCIKFRLSGCWPEHQYECKINKTNACRVPPHSTVTLFARLRG